MSLREGHRPTENYVTLLRAELPKRFPGIEFFFQPADIVTQILNFGLPAAIDVQFTGPNLAQNAALAAELVKAIQQIPGAVDVARAPAAGQPGVDLQMDRTRLQQVGLTAFNVGQNVLVSLSGSSQTAPAFWLNPQNGVVYNVAVQTPQYRVDSLDALLNIPVAGSGASSARQRRSCSAIWSRRSRPQARGRVALQHHAGGRRLRERAGHRPRQRGRQGERRSSTKIRPKLPRGSQVALRGQVQTMQASFIGLGVGLAMAIVLVYLLIVVNFQSWIDAAIIVAALPAALGGHRVDAVHHGHHAERARAHRRHHDAWASPRRTASCWCRSRASGMADGVDAAVRRRSKPAPRASARC